MNRNIVSARCDNGSIDATSNPTATATTASDVNALHLLHIGSKLASWTHADAHASLPAPLHHGPVHLLHGARENADSPHISTRLLDDTLVLLTYGVNYLNIRGSRNALLEQVSEHRAQRAIDKVNLHTHALRIQATWRCQRFATYRLVPLEFANSNPLLVEVQERMAKEKGLPTRGDLTTAEVEVNLEGLQLQINRYAEELRLRVEARKRAAEQQRLRLERERREQEDLHKKQYYQKKRRYENACRRWNYFTGRLLRMYHDESNSEIHSRVEARRQTLLPSSPQTPQQPSKLLKKQNSRHVMGMPPSARRFQKKRSSSNLHLQHSASPPSSTQVLTLMKSAAHRNFIRQFVAKVVSRGLSRVLCASNMDTTTANARITPLKPQVTLEARGGACDGSDVELQRLRIGILLCDVHFGVKYMSLYQRFLEKAAKEKHVAIEWQFFNCLKSEFPTAALRGVLDGFLVAGGPNNGAQPQYNGGNGATRPDTSESTDSQPAEEGASAENPGGLTTSSDAQRTRPVNKTHVPWRKNLHKVLRQIYNSKRAGLAGLGFGHVILAEALGAKCGHHEWEDGWNVLDSKLFDSTVLERNPREISGNGHCKLRASPPSKTKYVGIKYLHGEFVCSMDFAPRGMKIWRSLDQSFVSCFKDKYVLSFDGFPECGTFVLETMGELYDRDKHQHQTSSTAAAPPPLWKPSVLEDNPFSSPFNLLEQYPRPARRVGVIETVLTLDEKKRLLDVADISHAVAHAVLGHFQTTQSAAESNAKTRRDDGATAVVAVVNHPVECKDLEESIRTTAATSGVTSTLMRIRSTLDGHLVVLGAQLEAFVRDHERNIRESRRPPLVHATTTNGLLHHNSNGHEELLLSLHTLRDQKFVLLHHDSSLSIAPNDSKSNSRSGTKRGGSTLNMSNQLPTLKPSSAAFPLHDSVTTLPGSSIDAAALSHSSSSSNPPRDAPMLNGSRKRPTPVAKRLKSSGIGVLTLSEALDRYQSELVKMNENLSVSSSATTTATAKQQLQAPSTPPMLVLQFSDEEYEFHHLQQKSHTELRELWVRLVAALRVNEVPDDRVCILARQTMILDYLRRRQPLWTFMKDCRWSSNVLPPRHHIKRVSWYARYADVLLFDQDMLLSHSAKENETLFRQALYFGLKIFVARDESSNNSTTTSNNNGDDHRRGTSARDLAMSSPRTSLSRQCLNNRSTFRGTSMLAKAAAEKEYAMERDLQIVEILLLQLTGIDGVVTSTPEIAIEAKEKLLLKGPIMNQVEQLFRTWHSRGNDSKQAMLIRKHSPDGEIPEDEDADYIDNNVHDEGNDILDDRELALEMARQYAEHGVRRPPSPSFVPLRPLKPKRGDQVLGRTHHQHQRQSTFPPTDGNGTATNGLHSIGTFWTAFQRSHTLRMPPHCEAGAVWRLAGGNSDKAGALRGPEAVLKQMPAASPRTMRPPYQHVPTGNLR